jgi:hypothetical protein
MIVTVAMRHMRWRLRLAPLLSAVLVFAAGACSGRQQGSPTASATSPSTTTRPSTPETPSPKVGAWQSLPTAPIATPYVATGVWDGTHFLVVGRVSLRKAPYSNDVGAAYDPSKNAWQKLPGAPGPEGNFEGGDRSVWTGSEMLLWGVTNTAFDPATNTWRHLPPPPAGAGGPSVVVWTGTQMIGWGGGCCGGVDSDGAAYTEATTSWKKLPPSPLSGRHTTGAWDGTEMIVAGGDDSDGGHVFADAAAYDPTRRTWRSLPPMPVPRTGATAVWDGKEMLVVGGGRTPGLDHLLARGVAYDPTTNRWRWLPPMQFPREGQVAVWAGTKLLVWGGATQVGGRTTVPPHGEAYDPATNTWSGLPTAPIRGRVSSVAVWTGAEMVVWGGYPVAGGRPFDDGAAYYPR